MTRNTSLLSTVGLFATMAIAMPTPAAILPASYDFGSDTGKDNLADFTTNAAGSSSWSLQANSARFTGQSSGGRSGAATTTFTNLASGPGFEIEVDATASYQFWDTLEILALGSSSATGTSGSDINFANGVAVRFSNNNGSRLFQLFDKTDNSSFVSESWTLGTGAINFVFTGVFDGDDLVMSVTATKGESTQTLDHTLEDYALTHSFGNYAGVGAYIAGGTRSVDIDTFSISAIPEPASLALMGLGGLLMLGRGRKDRA